MRGFTRHTSSGVGERGTFRALTEKIPYLKELGITAVELMMPNEFQEVMMEDGADGESICDRGHRPDGSITGASGGGIPVRAESFIYIWGKRKNRSGNLRIW